MALMLAVTTTALLYLAFYQNLYQKFLNDAWMAEASTTAMASSVIQIVIALVLVGLALSLAYMGITNVRKARSAGPAVADGGDPVESDD
jgi:carbon starvation protein